MVRVSGGSRSRITTGYTGGDIHEVIKDQKVVQEPVTWSQQHEYVTASSNDTDHYGERVYQGEIIREHVET